MSNALYPIDVISVDTPETRLTNKREWLILEGPEKVTPYLYPSTSYSNSNWNFNIVIPSKQTILDRRIYMNTIATFTLGGPGTNTDNLIQPSRFALRSYALQKVMLAAVATINGFNVSWEPWKIMKLIERFNSSLEDKAGLQSLSTVYPDNYADYRDADLSLNNPLGSYVDSALPYTGRAAYNNINILTNTPTSAIFSVNITEALFLSPFLFHEDQSGGGLIHLDSLTFQFVFLNNLAAMLSISPSTTSTISSCSVSFSTPNMYMWFLSPKLLSSIPPIVQYPYFQISRYETDMASTIPPNSSLSIPTNVIQLNSIPLALYFFCDMQDSQRYATLTSSTQTTDTFLTINNISLNWNNSQGLLSSAPPQLLYNETRKGGLEMNYQEWSGYTYLPSSVSGQNTKIIGLSGGPLCLYLGRSIGLASDEAEGILGQFYLSCILNVTNQNQYTTITPRVTIVAVYDGTLTISNNSCIAEIGILSKMDVLNSRKNPHIDYNILHTVYGGSSFGTKIKNFFSSVGKFLWDHKGDIISTVAKVAPLLLGIGENDMAGYTRAGHSDAGSRAGHSDAGSKAGCMEDGGILIGGRHLSRKQLHERSRKRY